MTANIAIQTLSRDEVIGMLRAQIEKAGSLREWARRAKLSPAYISDIMRGRRDPGPPILAALKVQKVPDVPREPRYTRTAR